MPLFHFAPQRLGRGAIIEPGNFGRLLKRYTPGGFGNTWLLARELVFEDVRKEHFAALPSRMAAVFALPTRADADLYRNQVDPNYQTVLHEVELANEALPTHTASIAHCDMRDGVPFLDPTRTAAFNYWQGVSVAERANEIVAMSPLRVVRSVD